MNFTAAVAAAGSSTARCALVARSRALSRASRPTSVTPIKRWAPVPRAAPGGLGDEEIDVAVFRFTLGIPGFDDRNIPRVVGALGAALIVVNHFLGAAEIVPAAQTRAEFLGAFLAGVCIILPELEERLQELQPGRGRQRAADQVAGSTNCFHLAPSLGDAAKKELAWSSFALLKNTNSCSLMVLNNEGQAVMVRGAVGTQVASKGDAAAVLAAVTQDFQQMVQRSGELAAVALGQQQQRLLPDRGSVARVCAGSSSIPTGAECASLHHIPGAAGGSKGLLLLLSEKARGLTDKDRKWAGALASKLVDVL